MKEMTLKQWVGKAKYCLPLLFIVLASACGTNNTGGGPGGPNGSSGPGGNGTGPGSQKPGGDGEGPDELENPDTPVKDPFVSIDPNTNKEVRKSCGKPTDCAASEAECVGGKCYTGMSCAKITCGERERCERGKGKFTQYAFCVPDCDENEQCGGVCRTSSGAVCVDFQWTEPCADNRQHCLTESGPVCCGSGTACLNKQCIPVGADCDLDKEVYCQITDYCDMSIRKCVKYKYVCEFRPDSNNFEAKKKLNWDKETVYATPLVVDLDKDQTPEIVFTTSPNSYTGNLVAIRSAPGASGEAVEMWKVPKSVYSHVAPAAADLDGDGYPEVVVVNPKRDGIIAVHGNTGRIYFNKLGWGDFSAKAWAGGVTIGDIDGDGKPEIVALGAVWSNEGDMMFRLPFDYSKLHPRGGLVNSIPVLANIDNDPNNHLELIDGLCVFKYEPYPGGLFNMTQVTLNDTTKSVSERPYDNSPDERGSSTSAVANFFGNASTYPQIVAVHNGQVFIADHRGNILAKTSAPPIPLAALSDEDMRTRGARGGAPTIADFDGDGAPEIGVAFGHAYAVYDVNVDTQGGVTLSLLWSAPVRDYTSAITGSSVFDFDGDGKAEVVYNDEQMLRVYRGEGDGHGGGSVLFEVPNTTGTAAESAVIADVDNDGHADIVVASGPYDSGGTGGKLQTGVQVFSDVNNAWVPTRSIWNQHAYSVTNINTDGTVPSQGQNWKKGWLNNFRQNVQAGNPFLAPDFVVKASPIYQSGCAAGSPAQIRFNYKVQNLGSATAKANKIRVIAKTVLADGTENQVFNHLIDQDLPPSSEASFNDTLQIQGTPLEGKSFDLKFIVDPDNGYSECNEENNEYVVSDVGSGGKDVAVEVNVLNPISCPTQDRADVQFKVINNGKDEIPANTLKIKLYATVGSGQKFLVDTVPVTKAVPGESSVMIDYPWTPFGSEKRNRLVTLEAVIDEENVLAECDESNNRGETVFVCQQLG